MDSYIIFSSISYSDYYINIFASSVKISEIISDKLSSYNNSSLLFKYQSDYLSAIIWFYLFYNNFCKSEIYYFKNSFVAY